MEEAEKETPEKLAENSGRGAMEAPREWFRKEARVSGIRSCSVVSSDKDWKWRLLVTPAAEQEGAAEGVRD